MSLLLLSAVLLLASSVSSYSSGPPTSVCRSLAPDPSAAGHNALSLTSHIPFDLTVVNSPLSTYYNGQTLLLELSNSGKKSFVGFFVQGRNIEGNPVGSFSPQNEYQQLIHCPGVIGNSIAHYNTADESFVSQEFLWTAIGTETNNITFFYTVVHEMDEFWAHHEGPTLHYTSNAIMLTLHNCMFLLLVAYSFQ